VLAFVLIVGNAPVALANYIENGYPKTTVMETGACKGFFVSANELNVETLTLEVGKNIDLAVLLGEEIKRAEISSNEDFVLVSPNILTEDGMARIEGRSVGESDITITFLAHHSLAATITPSALSVAIHNYPNGTQIQEDVDNDTEEEAKEPIIKTIRVYVIEPVAFAPLNVVAPTFFDDFTHDTLFWNISGEMGTDMVLHNNALVTDSVGWSSATTRGRLWDNFTAEIEFTMFGAYTGGFVLFNIREVSNYRLRILIRENRISVIRESDGVWEVESEVIFHPFTRYAKHILKIEADEQDITLSVRRYDEVSFTHLNTLSYTRTDAGTISLQTFNDQIAVESVRITDNNTPHYFFFADTFARIGVGANQAIYPTNSTIHPIDSIYFSSSDPSVITVDATTGEITAYSAGIAMITATAEINGITYTASYDIAVYATLSSLAFIYAHMSYVFSRPSQTLRVGETLNLSLSAYPAYAANQHIVWTTDNPLAIQLVGDDDLSRGVRALAPADNISVRATSLENGAIYAETTIHVLPTVNTAVDRVFALPNSPRQIPEHFWGVNLGYTTNLINRSDVPERQIIIDFEDNEYPFLRSLQPQTVRFILEHYDSATGTNRLYNSTMDVPFTLSDVLRHPIRLDVPVNIATSSHYSAQEMIDLIKEARSIVGYGRLFVSIMNEPWDPIHEGRFTVYDYMQIVQEVYQAVKPIYPDITIGVFVLPYTFDLIFNAQPTIPGTGHHRLATWNAHVAQNQNYFDAIVVHHYSGLWNLHGISTDNLMEDFSAAAAVQRYDVERLSNIFYGKEIWYTEFGDLPFLHFPILHPMSDNTRARLQYPKSVGNAIGYVQRLFTLLESKEVTMANYYSFNHTHGFGVIQRSYAQYRPSDDTLMPLPSYFAFREVGRIFNEYSHVYPLVPPPQNSYSLSISFGPTPTVVDVHRLSGWAFGDGDGLSQAVFVNTSDTPANISIPSHVFRKTWSYGGGNPLPDFAVNQVGYWTHLPTYVPHPTVHSGNFSSVLEIPAYSMIIADIRATYPVTVATGVSDYVSVSHTVAMVGDTITVTITPPSNQRLAADGVTATGVTTFIGNTVGSTTVAFAKTAEVTEVNAIFENIPLEIFTIAFNPNSGIVTPTSGTAGTDGRLATLPTPTRAGYNFIGWFTQATGGTQVTAGATGTVFDADTTIFARWATLPVHAITYHANDGTGIMPSANVISGDNHTVSANGFTRTGYTFIGWNTQANGGGTAHAVGAVITVTANISLYAQWIVVDDSQDGDNNNQGGDNNNQGNDQNSQSDNNGTTMPRSTPVPAPTPEPTSTPTPDITPQPTPAPVLIPFTDISPTAWYYSFVRAVWEQQLFQGTAPTTFTPQGSMTRAMFVQVLANLEGVDLTAYRTQTATFNDTASDSWYFGAIEWAVRQEFVNGVGNSNFAPSRLITREEMAVMLNRYIVSRVVVLPQNEISLFTDHDSISTWAQDDVAAIQAAGIITGHPDGRFAPQDTATRAEVATIFARFLEVADLPRRDGSSVV